MSRTVAGAPPFWLTFLLLFLLTLGGWACKNPFATREAEEPLTSRSRWIPPNQPQDVLENLRNAIAEEHIPNYLKCLSDSTETGAPFVFKAEPNVVANYPELFVHWGLANERRYVDQLFQATPVDSVRRLVFANVTERVGEQNERLLVADYTLDVHHTLGSQGLPRHAQGRAEFWLIQDERTSYWYISEWRDSATGENPTWSALKAAFGR